MKDNAKCAGNGCPIRDGCDRFVRPVVDGQQWVEPDWRHAAVPLWLADDVVQMAHCDSHAPVKDAEPVQSHGGASEEGAAC